MIFILIIIATLFIKEFSFSVIESNGSIPEQMIKKFTLVLPIALALIFVSKKIQDNKRLEQAYLHKKVVTQSYLNFIEYISKNYDEEEAKAIKADLSKVAIESLGLNPALLLDKSTAEQLPAESLTMKILDKISLSNKSTPTNNGGN